MWVLGEPFPNLAALGVTGLSGTAEKPIIFGVKEDALFQGLAHAMSLAFPNYSIRFDEKIVNSQTASLILLASDRTDDLHSTLAELKQRYPVSAIGIMWTGNLSDGKIHRAAAAQELTQGVLPINMPLRVWLAAIWLLLNGGRYIPPSLWIHGDQTGAYSIDTTGITSISNISPKLPVSLDHLSNLTNREREVLWLLAKGFQNKIIAHRLDLSEHTIKIHVHNIIQKLGVHNRTQVACLINNRFNGSE